MARDVARVADQVQDGEASCSDQHGFEGEVGAEPADLDLRAQWDEGYAQQEHGLRVVQRERHEAYRGR